jgi:hypothetical protein
LGVMAGAEGAGGCGVVVSGFSGSLRDFHMAESPGILRLARPQNPEPITPEGRIA